MPSPSRSLAGLIRLYQRTLSFDHGPLRYLTHFPRCRFYPTCSEYIRQAILKYGVLHGTRRGIERLLKCHPWHPGGIDEVE